MASQDDRARAAQFTATTHATPERILEVGRRAADAAKSPFNTTVKVGPGGDNYQTYVMVGPGGFVQQMQIVVRWEEVGEGLRRVNLEMGSYLTSQSKIMFIPVGTKSIVALRPLERFSSLLRGELEGTVTG